MGATPSIHSLAFLGRTDELERLSKEGVDIIHPRENGKTPLHLATDEGHPATVQLLLSYGADVDAVDEDGNTSLHMLCSRNPEERSSVDIATQIYNALLSAHSQVNLQNKQGCTPLHLALDAHSVDLSTLLLQSGADPLLRNNEGDTAHDLYKIWPLPELSNLLSQPISPPPSVEMREIA